MTRALGWGLLIVVGIALFVGLATKPGSEREASEATFKDVDAGASATLPTPQQDVASTADAMRERLQEEQKVAYQKSVEGVLETADKRIQDLQAKADAAETPEAKTELHATVEQLQRNVETVRAELNALKTSSADAWGQEKAALERAMEDLERTLSQSLARSTESVSAL